MIKLLQLIIVIIFCLLKVNAVYAHDFEYKGMYYDIISSSEKTVRLTRRGKSYSEREKIVVPQNVKFKRKRYSVIEIGSRAFKNSKKLTTLTIGENVEAIEEGAFNGCENLEIVTFNAKNCLVMNGFENGNYCSVFKDCNKLKKVIIGKGVSRIPYYAFCNCVGLKDIEFSNSVTEIGKFAFYGCRSLNAIKIPNAVTIIGECAFADCDSLMNIEIPTGIKEISRGLFFRCKNLSQLILPKTIEIIRERAFESCERIKNFIIPNSVKVVEREAFYDCIRLESIQMSNSMREIGDEMFYNCASLKNIRNFNAIESVGNKAFYNCNNLTTITLPNSMKKLGDGVFYGCNNLKEIICLSNTPPMCENISIRTRDVIVYVPLESVELYESASGWLYFKKIYPIDD